MCHRSTPPGRGQTEQDISAQTEPPKTWCFWESIASQLTKRLSFVVFWFGSFFSLRENGLKGVTKSPPPHPTPFTYWEGSPHKWEPPKLHCCLLKVESDPLVSAPSLAPHACQSYYICTVASEDTLGGFWI